MPPVLLLSIAMGPHWHKTSLPVTYLSVRFLTRIWPFPRSMVQSTFRGLFTLKVSKVLWLGSWFNSIQDADILLSIMVVETFIGKELVILALATKGERTSNLLSNICWQLGSSLPGFLGSGACQTPCSRTSCITTAHWCNVKQNVESTITPLSRSGHGFFRRNSAASWAQQGLYCGAYSTVHKWCDRSAPWCLFTVVFNVLYKMQEISQLYVLTEEGMAALLEIIKYMFLKALFRSHSGRCRISYREAWSKKNSNAYITGSRDGVRWDSGARDGWRLSKRHYCQRLVQ